MTMTRHDGTAGSLGYEDVQRIGQDLLKAGRLRDALAHYDRALGAWVQGRPGAGTPNDNQLGRVVAERGQLLYRLRHLLLAMRDFDRATELDPTLVSPHANKASALQDLGRLDEAIREHDRAVAAAPDRAELHYNRGNALARANRHDEALAAYQAAVAAAPDFQQARQALIGKLWLDNRLDEALSHAWQACQARPRDPEPKIGYGLLMHSLGRKAEARNAYSAALTLQPLHPTALYNLAQLDKVRDDGAALLARLHEAQRRTDFGADEKVMFEYALGKAYDDLQRIDDAFHYFQAGATRKRALVDHDEDRERRALQLRLQGFDAEVVARYAPSGLDTEVPVFVVGMPRSGTTLVEQILASHPQVHGAGELSVLKKMTADVRIGSRRIDGVDVPVDDDFHRLPEIAQSYLDELRGLAPDDAARVVDKMPSNAWRVGLIHMMFPNARIVHCVRDPIDTCLSCFQKLFTFGHSYSYELGELGRHYVRHDRLMAHWEQILPGRMLTMRYEDVVRDLEGQARRIVDHVGLPWDPACLAFHRTNRPVLTASNSQVREPIYGSSVGRWQAYRDHLGPLIKALGRLARHARDADGAGDDRAAASAAAARR